MGIIRSLFEKRSTLSDPAQWMFGNNKSYTGKNVKADNALTLTAVYACVRILSETIASLPLNVYERMDKGKKKASNHYLHSVLHDKANDEMTSFTFRETLMNHLLLWGNAYAEIQRDGAGRVVGLWLMNPEKTFPERHNGQLRYKTILPDGSGAILPKEKVLHIAGMGSNGLVGYNPISLAREAIGLGLASEEHGARFFGDGAMPSGVLEHPSTMSEQAQKNFRTSWNEMHQGLKKSHRIAILEEGLSYKQTSLNNNDSQWLESRKFQVQEIARFFRVPPHMLADLERATFSNIEQQSIDFVTHSIRPWLVRIEQAINAKLINNKKYFVEFKVDGLLRGDIQSRYEAYATARQNGWLSANDIRELENMNPLPDNQGDQYLVPLNMIPASSLDSVVEEKTTDNEGSRSIEKRSIETRQQQSAEIRRRLTQSYTKVLERNLSNIMDKEQNELNKLIDKHLNTRNTETFISAVNDFYGKFEGEISQSMMPVFLMIMESMRSETANEIDSEETEVNNELQQFVRDYSIYFASRYLAESKHKLKQLDLESNSTDEIKSVITDWKVTRIEDVSKEETVRASNSFTKRSYQDLGVTKLRWVTTSDSCPICNRMDGKVIGIDSFFIRKGEELDLGENETPFRPSKNVGHAPLHRKCDCTVSAVR